ncbi:MAG: PfkB family carbohydrate kinase [Candidatus Omnitrophota bacterium]|jgi:rfaE bifunctional protein nucleotidyltransferase chain/domain
MPTSKKILSFIEAKNVFGKLRKRGKKIVQCHGTFDLIHPGHIVHFEEARALGDVLVVTVTGEKYVNKGPGRPYFNDALRAKSLAALQCVDYVVVVPFPAAVEAIEQVCPHIYCKGREYKNPETDVSGNINDDVKTVERLGGRVSYVGSVVFSSTRLLNKHFEVHPQGIKDFCKKLEKKCPPNDFRKIVEGFKDIRVLVIGDIIFDHYSTVKVQGLTSKNRIISARLIRHEMQAGGALAVFRHVRQFTPHVKLISLVGREPWVNGLLSDYVSRKEDGIIRHKDFITIIKQRFVEPINEGKELSKLFSVNMISQRHPEEDIQKKIYDKISGCIEDYDLVMMMDFGHGLGAESIRKLVQERSRFLALNCQTNSNNHGFNLIDRQYYRADSFSLDETELSLACGKRDMQYNEELLKLHDKLGARYSWLTRGATDTIGIKTGEPECICAPLETSIVDTIGAGDAFSSLASLAAVKGLPIDVATFMGQLAGAQAVRIVGNAESVNKNKFLKGGMSLLSF